MQLFWYYAYLQLSQHLHGARSRQQPAGIGHSNRSANARQFALDGVGMKEAIDHLTLMEHAAQNRCFGCGQANPAGLRLEFMLSPDGTVVCLPTISESFEGHPGYLHGGVIATLLDEAMSKSVRARGLTAMTRQIEADFLRPVPSATPIRIEGRVVRSEGRKHWTEARILNARGTVLAHAKGLFIELRARAKA
jgi:uncharacterized protein (TIGR00369 family)